MADRPTYRLGRRLPAIAPGVIMVLLALPTALTAQAPRPASTLSLVYVGAPLDEALRALASEAHVSLVYDAELVRGKRAFCRRIDTAVEPLLNCILEGTGLDFHRLSSGTYVIREAPRSDAPGAVIGRVVDAVSGLPVPDANVVISSYAGGTASNSAGRFAVGSLDPGPRRVTVTHISYQDAVDSVFVPPFGESRLTVTLAPKTRMVKPIVVSGFRERIPVSTYDHPSSRLDPHDLSNERSRDVLSSLDAVSGVRFGDAMSDVHVQGGAAGEHQYRLDGATLFVPLRNGGVVGPFSPFAIRQITIRKAGYGAGFGSQLSGVVEVDQEVGSADEIDAMIQADELAVNGRLSGRMGREGGVRASWMIGGRRDLWDVYKPGYVENVIDEWSRPDTLLASLLQDDPASAVSTGGSHTVGFSDIHASVIVQTGLSNSLHVFHYTGSNRFGTDGDRLVEDSEKVKDSYHWRNAISGMGFESIVSSRILAEVSVWSSNYEMRHPFDRSAFAGDSEIICEGCSEADDFNDVEEVGTRSRIDIAAADRHFLSVGSEAVRTASEMSITIHPDGASLGSDANHYELGVWRLSGFVEDRWTVSSSTELRLGTRLTWLEGSSHAYVEPRISLRYDQALSESRSFAAELAAGLYRQYLHQFDTATFSTTALLPSIRFWQPVAGDQSPPEALHLTGAFSFRPSDRWRLVVETFLKSLPHIVEINRAGPIGASAPDLLVDAEARGYGFSASVQHTVDRLDLAVHYDFERSERQIPRRFGGSWQPVPWNVPHSVRFLADAGPFRGFGFTARWRALIGRSWAFRQAYYDFLEPNPDTRLLDPYDLSDPSTQKLPVFSQLDVGAAYTFELSQSTAQMFVQVLNVFDRANQLDRWLAADEETGGYTYVPRTWIGRAISVSARISI